MANEGFGKPDRGMPSSLETELSSMKAREKRFSWITLRTHQTKGTLAKLSSIDFSSPDKTALEDLDG